MRFFYSLIIAISCSTAFSAENFIIADNQTGHILAGMGANRRVPIANLTNLALALVVLDWAAVKGGNLERTAIVPEDAISNTDSINTLNLHSGDLLTLRDLLFACLLASDDAVAVTLAYFLGKELPNPKRLTPVANTVSQMNALARNLGMHHTLFLNPHGIDHGHQSGSTAADLARLTRYGYSTPGLRFYVSQRSRQIHLQRGTTRLNIKITNTNRLLDINRIDGVRTGRSPQAGECIILTSEQMPEVKHLGNTFFITPRRIIVVLLGSSNREQEGIALINHGWALYNDWKLQGRPIKISNCL